MLTGWYGISFFHIFKILKWSKLQIYLFLSQLIIDNIFTQFISILSLTISREKREMEGKNPEFDHFSTISISLLDRSIDQASSTPLERGSHWKSLSDKRVGTRCASGFETRSREERRWIWSMRITTVCKTRYQATGILSFPSHVQTVLSPPL